MKITELQIENIIYESPWLLDERFIIPKISGSRGENGRQINVGKENNRFIDLLFKDTRDNRPVIIELKKGKIIRENIAQTLEYRALITSLNEESKEKWITEFGQNYYAPKMILIGSEADEDTILSANLTGIEVRTFETTYDSKIGFETFKDLKSKLKEWNSLRNSGNRTLIDREEWIENLVERINHILNKEFKEVTTINSPHYINSKKCFYSYTFPFINIPFFYKEEILIGLYEYYDELLPFDEKYFYCDYDFLFEKESKKELTDEIISLAKKRMEKLGYELVSYPEYEISVLKLPRTILENEEEFKKTIKIVINTAIELFDKL